ncbi:hypothetical protein LY76DRAFT_585809 [Colletotrichum caudatum]|nr:hypothetical protein LY76DRAFT_585809 [Colletotrichum caudatum]
MICPPTRRWPANGSDFTKQGPLLANGPLEDGIHIPLATAPGLASFHVAAGEPHRREGEIAYMEAIP